MAADPTPTPEAAERRRRSRALAGAIIAELERIRKEGLDALEVAAQEGQTKNDASLTSARAVMASR